MPEGYAAQFFEDLRIKYRTGKTPRVNPLYFKVTKNNKISYILGTYHYWPVDALPLEVWDTLWTVKSVITELGDQSREMPDNYYDKGDYKWDYELSEEVESELRIALNIQSHLGLEQFSPWILWDAYIGKICSQGMDCIFIELLTSMAKIPLYYLETFSERNAISKSNEKIEAWQLDGRVKGVLTNEIFAQTYDEYSSGAIIYAPLLVNDLRHDADRYQRHTLWIERIDLYHNKLLGDSAFLFGAAHLAGELGILKLLHNIGYSIEKMNPNGAWDKFPIQQILGINKIKRHPNIYFSAPCLIKRLFRYNVANQDIIHSTINSAVCNLERMGVVYNKFIPYFGKYIYYCSGDKDIANIKSYILHALQNFYENKTKKQFLVRYNKFLSKGRDFGRVTDGGSCQITNKFKDPSSWSILPPTIA